MELEYQINEDLFKKPYSSNRKRCGNPSCHSTFTFKDFKSENSELSEKILILYWNSPLFKILCCKCCREFRSEELKIRNFEDESRFTLKDKIKRIEVEKYRTIIEWN